MKRVALALAFAGCAGSPATARGPSSVVRADVDLAETAERARQHDRAREHYQRAVADAHDPASVAFARHEFAETLISWGEYPEATAQLEGAVAAAPDDAGAWHDLGMLEHQRGDDTGALAALGRAKSLAPTDPRPRIALAALRWTRGDRAGAASEYHELLALDLPDRLRTKVEWALDQLAKPATERHTPR